jgi:hypothetical protein
MLSTGSNKNWAACSANWSRTPLFPLDEYFHGPSRIGPGRATTARQIPGAARPAHLEFPQLVGKTA